MAELKKEVLKTEKAKSSVKPVDKKVVAKSAAKTVAVKPAPKRAEAKPATKAVTKTVAAKPAEIVATKKAEAKPDITKIDVKKPEMKTADKKAVKAVKPVQKEKVKKEKGKLPYVSNGEIRVELIKSVNGCTIRQIRTVQALGLKKMHEVRVHKDNPAIRGMCDLVAHLVKVEKVG